MCPVSAHSNGRLNIRWCRPSALEKASLNTVSFSNFMAEHDEEDYTLPTPSYVSVLTSRRVGRLSLRAQVLFAIVSSWLWE